MCDSCSVCAQYSRTLTKEPMKSLPIPTQTWQIVSQNIFTHEQKDYLVTVCHFSDWIEVDELQDTLSATVINKTKAHFARFGIPQICHTDNGSQFSSKEYENFATQYGFKHTTSSPYHPQGNSRAEAAVKVAKSTLKKSADFQTALLNYRNTPLQGHTYSPVQRTLCRRTRTTLPTPNHLIKPLTSQPRCRHSRAHPEASREQTLLRQQTDQSTSRPCCRFQRICKTSTYTEESSMDTWNYHLPGHT